MGLETVLVLVAFLGCLSHVLWFIHGEHDFYSRRYAALWAFTQAIGFYGLTRLTEQSIMECCLTMTFVSMSYLAAIFGSMAIYRLFLHRLKDFPGPICWKLSKLAQVVANLDSMGYKHLHRLHEHYGEFVRVGPNELSVTHPSAPELVLASTSRCAKAIWYDISMYRWQTKHRLKLQNRTDSNFRKGKPLLSTHQCRDKKIHDIRRRAWNMAFSNKALKNYESRVFGVTDILIKQINGFGGEAFDASKWFNYYTLDVIGSLAFGESFHMLETGEKHLAIRLLEAAMEPMNMIPAAPWLFYLLSPLPFVTSNYYKFYEWSYDQAAKRRAKESNESDIVQYIFEAAPISPDAEVNKNWETGDARLIILAGSETTTSTLTYCIYELIKNPAVTQALRNEIDPLMRDDGLDYTALQRSPYLNGVIDETLRLHPAVPSGFMRIAPPEGLVIGETFVPGGTHITLPSYTIHRSPNAFEQPNDFIPERWFSNPSLVKNKTAHHPFSFGSFNCAGKGLAYMELRIALSRLIFEFDIQFAAGEDGSGLVEQTEDHFSLRLAALSIVCKARHSSHRR